MRIAVERRGDEWLAQVVHIGDGLHWVEHRVIHNKMAEWTRINCIGQHYISGWQFFFVDEQDLTLFLLKWHNNDSTD